MSDTEHGWDSSDDLPAYMDLLSHDILNMNQTVLSCIDLMTASQRLDDRSKKHAMRAASQMRVSSQIFESIKTLCLLRRGDRLLYETVDLEAEITRAGQALSSMLPDKELHVTIEKAGGRTMVPGGQMVYNALLNALTNMAQLDAADRVDINVDVRPAEGCDAGVWEVCVSDAKATMLESFDPESLRADLAASRSRVVRIAGLLLSKMMVERLGGSVEVKSSDGDGCTFVLTLKEELPQ